MSSKHSGMRLIAYLLATSYVPLMSQNYNFKPFSVPFPPKGGTTAQAINNRGAIVGYMAFAVRTSNGNVVPATRGFKRDADGVFEFPIIDPNDTFYFTIADGINDSGLVVGRYQGPAANQYHGFLRDSSGNFTTVDVGTGGNTWVLGVNDLGSFVGAFGTMIPPEHGFVNINGTVTQIDVPGAPETQAYGIARDGTIVGCTGKNGQNLFFLRGPKGKYQTFSIPNTQFVCALGINNKAGMIVGYYVDKAFGYHGFVYNYLANPANAEAESPTVPSIVTVDYPGATNTEVTGINSKGIITGWAQVVPSTGDEPPFGFIGTPAP